MESISIQSYLAQLGNRKDPHTGAVSAPIYLSTAYGHPGLGQSTGYDYTRTANPTRDILQEGLAVLENGVQGFATSSGMSAISLLSAFFRPTAILLHPGIFTAAASAISRIWRKRLLFLHLCR